MEVAGSRLPSLFLSGLEVMLQNTAHFSNTERTQSIEYLFIYQSIEYFFIYQSIEYFFYLSINQLTHL